MKTLSKTKVIKAFQYVQREAKKYPDTLEEYLGICYYVNSQLRGLAVDIYDLCSFIFKGWEYHSGRMDYPIYKGEGDHNWKGDQLELRKKLLKYSIKKLKAMSSEEFQALVKAVRMNNR